MEELWSFSTARQKEIALQKYAVADLTKTVMEGSTTRIQTAVLTQTEMDSLI